MDRAGKATSSIPTLEAAIIGNWVSTGRGVSGGVLLGTGGRGFWRAAKREDFFVSYSSMMDITCDINHCVLTDFLNFFCKFPLSEFYGSLSRFLLLIVYCLLMEALPSFDPCQDASSSFFSLERYLNSCRVCQWRSTTVLPRPSNVTAETLTGFCFVGLDF